MDTTTISGRVQATAEIVDEVTSYFVSSNSSGLVAKATAVLLGDFNRVSVGGLNAVAVLSDSQGASAFAAISGGITSIGGLGADLSGLVLLRSYGAISASSAENLTGQANLRSDGGLLGDAVTTPSSGTDAIIGMLGGIISTGRTGTGVAATAVVRGVGAVDAAGSTAVLARSVRRGAGGLVAAGVVGEGGRGSFFSSLISEIRAIPGAGGLQQGAALLRGDGQVLADLTALFEGAKEFIGSSDFYSDAQVKPPSSVNTQYGVVGDLNVTGQVGSLKEAAGLINFVSDFYAHLVALLKGQTFLHGDSDLHALGRIISSASAEAGYEILGKIDAVGETGTLREGAGLLRFVAELVARVSATIRGETFLDGRGGLYAEPQILPFEDASGYFPFEGGLDAEGVVGQLRFGAGLVRFVADIVAKITAIIKGQTFLEAEGGIWAAGEVLPFREQGGLLHIVGGLVGNAGVRGLQEGVAVLRGAGGVEALPTNRFLGRHESRGRGRLYAILTNFNGEAFLDGVGGIYALGGSTYNFGPATLRGKGDFGKKDYFVGVIEDARLHGTAGLIAEASSDYVGEAVLSGRGGLLAVGEGACGVVRFWDGSQWVPEFLKFWDGQEWVFSCGMRWTEGGWHKF